MTDALITQLVEALTEARCTIAGLLQRPWSGCDADKRLLDKLDAILSAAAKSTVPQADDLCARLVHELKSALKETRNYIYNDDCICRACGGRTKHKVDCISLRVDRLLLSAAKPSGSDGWRTMDRAPKDGTQIIICTENGTRNICWWANGRWSYGGGSWESDFAKIRVWQTLPPAPPSQDGEG